MWFFLALCLLVASTEHAHALALAPFVAAALAISIEAATVIVAVASIAVSFGISYVANKLLAKKPEDRPQSAGGVQLDVRVDPDVPQSILFGRAVTAGSLVHAATFGTAPGSGIYQTIYNNELIEFFAVADHPVQGLVKVYVEGQPVTLEVEVAERGFPITEYLGASGPSNLAYKFFDGTQVTADAFSVTRLGNDSDFPWTTSHIGVGRAYLRAHYILNAQRVPGRFRWKMVVDGIKLYDPRLDTTVGGSGSHIYTTLSTHEWTDNPAVIAYNILRGIYVLNGASQRVFFYGIEGTAAAQLPLDVWFAAMNECDSLSAIPGSSTEKQFRVGAEVTLDTPPMDTIKEILKATGGKVVENGGVYKFYIGTPSLPVLTFTDDSIISIAPDSFRPILGLENRTNYITGSYTSPDEDWVPKIAPPRSNSDWEDEDGRRLPADLNAPMVQSADQMQRLMQQFLMRSRQQRKHSITLPPSAFHVEPGDYVEWTSTRNGYVAKLFEVDAVDYQTNMNITLSITEVDPADYDYDQNIDTLPEVIAPPVSILPDSKVMIDFAVSSFVYSGSSGTNKPAILLTWTDPEDGDVIAIQWQLRPAADPTNVSEGRTTDVTTQQTVILGGLQSNTNYEVRARPESLNDYETSWTLWIAVTTPEVLITNAELDSAIQSKLTQIGGLAQLTTELGELILQQNQILLGVQSLAQDASASGLLRIIAATTPSDALSMIEIQTRAAIGWLYSLAGLQFVAYANADGTTSSRMRLYADSVQIGQPDASSGGDFINLFEVGTVNDEPAIILRAALFQDNGIGTKALDVGAAATVIPFTDTDQTRSFTAWNNSGAGEEFSTLTCALNGDGVVIIDLKTVTTQGTAYTQTNSKVTIEANGVEIFTIPQAQVGQLGPKFYRCVTSALAAGTNTFVAKFYLPSDSGTGGSQTVGFTEINWLVMEHRKPAVQAGGAAAATRTYHSTQTSVSLASGTTFSGLAIGTAATNRRVVVGIGFLNGSFVVNNVTIGGIAADLIKSVRAGTSGTVAQMWAATVPAGTTADIVVDAGRGHVYTNFTMSVWSITTAAEAVVDTHSDWKDPAVSPETVADLEIQVGGVALAFAYGYHRNTFALTWGGADTVTEDAEADNSDSHYAAYGFLTTESSLLNDLTFTHSANGTGAKSIVIGASWR